MHDMTLLPPRTPCDGIAPIAAPAQVGLGSEGAPILTTNNMLAWYDTYQEVVDMVEDRAELDGEWNGATPSPNLDPARPFMTHPCVVRMRLKIVTAALCGMACRAGEKGEGGGSRFPAHALTL